MRFLNHPHPRHKAFCHSEERFGARLRAGDEESACHAIPAPRLFSNMVLVHVVIPRACDFSATASPPPNVVILNEPAERRRLRDLLRFCF
jgi:hypothetical protein